ncbi:MAG: hypothetical protein DRI92_06420 [Aquificota bacterium]|nr:MAG: hypothetical protein DRI92_06420 [Aquificota bacterium]
MQQELLQYTSVGTSRTLQAMDMQRLMFTPADMDLAIWRRTSGVRVLMIQLEELTHGSILTHQHMHIQRKYMLASTIQLKEEHMHGALLSTI